MVDDASDKSIQAAAKNIGRLLRAQARPHVIFRRRLQNWVPEPMAQRYASIAAQWLKIIGARGLELAVREFPRLGEKGCRFVHPGKIEKVEDLGRFLDDIGFLAHVQYAISLGEHEGLRLLAGEDAVRGRKVVKAAGEGGKARRHLTRDRWQVLANAYWKDHPSASKSDAALHVCVHLGLSSKTVQAIRKAIHRPAQAKSAA